MSRQREIRSARTAVALSAAATVMLAASLLSGCAAAGDADAGDDTSASSSSEHDPTRTLADPALTDIAMQLVSSAENSNLDWKANYGYLEDIGDDRGCTGGIIGFTTATGDLLEVVERYTESTPGNALAPYLPALKKVVGSPSHDGLDAGFE
ncbi:hypothetical protein GCM10027515_07850 [Schumannella luteola]|uniref:Chitosanase n=1 Tax=Schumannella luteola TaxID=472059 RepID=A0A852YLJ7_9MICO|nr:hypothetical protein [Schumannella luteola]